MMKIFKITKKRNGNFNLYLMDSNNDFQDLKKGEFLNYFQYKEKLRQNGIKIIEFHIEILYKYKLQKNMELNDCELSLILDENEKLIAKQTAIKILSYSSKTEKELKNKLKQKKFSDENIKNAISFVNRYNFIDEKTIANNLVENNYKRKKYSKRKIIYKLKEKGIDEKTIDEVTKNIDSNEEFKNALYFGKKKLKTLKEEDINKKKQKIFNYLSYRGFDFYLINKVIEEII